MCAHGPPRARRATAAVRPLQPQRHCYDPLGELARRPKYPRPSISFSDVLAIFFCGVCEYGLCAYVFMYVCMNVDIDLCTWIISREILLRPVELQHDETLSGSAWCVKSSARSNIWTGQEIVDELKFKFYGWQPKNFVGVTQITLFDLPWRKLFQHFLFQWNFRSAWQANDQAFIVCVYLFCWSATIGRVHEIWCKEFWPKARCRRTHSRSEKFFWTTSGRAPQPEKAAHKCDRGRQRRKYSTHIIQVDTKRLAQRHTDFKNKQKSICKGN